MEVSAGISRAAIENMNRNGHRKPARSAPPAIPDTSALTTSKNTEPVPELTHVLLTHNRQLDLINVNGWHFQIRDTHYALGTVQCGTLHLNRPELEKLELTIHRVLEQAGAPRAEE